MFSIFKKASVAQDVVLRDLSEDQLNQVSGGNCSSSNDSDSSSSYTTHKKHKHHHHKKHMSWCKSYCGGSCNCGCSSSSSSSKW